MPNEAIERAARAIYEAQGLQAGLNPPWESLNALQREPYLRESRAAISAFLADVPVSVEMIECGLGAYDDCDARSGLGGFDSEVAQYKAMSAKLAEEIQ